MARTHFASLLLLAVPAVIAACAAKDDANESSSDESAEAVSGAGNRVCSWNMRRLGNPFEGRPKQMAVAAEIIKDNCDLLAIEETMATDTSKSDQPKDGGTISDHEGFDELLASMGSAWGGLITQAAAPFPETSNSEYYGFLYRKSAASVCENWGPNAMRLPDPQDIFQREPGWGCFKLKSRDKELILAGYHATFGEPAERKREVGFLQADLNNDGQPDDVFTTIQASRPGADFIFAGDFNLTNGEIATVLPNYKDLTNGNGSTLDYMSNLSTNEYDHMLVLPSSPLASNPPAVPLDVRSDYHPADAGVSDSGIPTASFYMDVSDHIPIRIVLQ